MQPYVSIFACFALFRLACLIRTVFLFYFRVIPLRNLTENTTGPFSQIPDDHLLCEQDRNCLDSGIPMVIHLTTKEGSHSSPDNTLVMLLALDDNIHPRKIVFRVQGYCLIPGRFSISHFLLFHWA